MKLFGHPDSGHAYKVRLALVTAGVAHGYEVVDIWQAPATRSNAFRGASRFGEVPCLLDGGQAYVQSGAILVHLMDRHELWPVVEDRRRLVLEWLMWEANRIGMCLPQLRYARRFEPTAVNAGAIDWLSARFESDAARLALELADGRAFVTGDTPSVADFALCGYLYFADEAEVDVPTAVGDWLMRIAALPGWRAPYELMAV